MMVVALIAGLATAQAATGVDQKNGVAVSPVGKTVLQGTVTGGGYYLPGSTATPELLRFSTFWPAFWRVCAALIANSASFLP